MDLERYSAKMILVPWDMMCDRKDRRTERTGGKKYRRKEIQEIKKGQKKKTPKLTFRV